jgi:Fe-S cluster biogenesis protein NfuA
MHEDMQGHEERAAQLETLLAEVAAFSDQQARTTTETVIQTLLELYGDGLARILALLQQQATGSELVTMLAQDELVASLLLLHGLHPLPLEARVARALADMQPYVRDHGGKLELLRIDDGNAYLRLGGSCQGCSSSTTLLKQTVAETLSKTVPDLLHIEFESASAGAGNAVPVTFMQPRRQQEKVKNNAHI